MGLQAWYPPDYACEAEIEANPDIGGIGVLSSFIVVSWITILVAGVPALHEAVESYRDPKKLYLLRNKAASDSQQDPRPRSDLDNPTFAEVTKKCEKLLGSLSDLQAITGISIIVAGWAQIDTIDYYHEQLIMSYWWLTLNSFWASRADFLDPDLEQDKIRVGIRRGTIFCSCVLGLSFQGYIIQREYDTWDDDQGPCYRYYDGSSAIPWMVGVGFFCIALLSTFSERTKKLNKWYFKSIEDINKNLKDWCDNSRQSRDGGISQPASQPASKRNAKWLMASFELALAWICRSLWFVLVLWLAVWSYGDGFWPVTWCFYVLFDIWNTFNAISLWQLNQVIIKGDAERQIKSFGQVLPLVLISAIVFSAVDIFREKLKVKDIKQYKAFVARYDASEIYMNENPNQSTLPI